MSHSNQTKVKRQRIVKGIVVASTNALKYSRIKVEELAHYYNPINYRRVNKVVVNT